MKKALAATLGAMIVMSPIAAFADGTGAAVSDTLTKQERTALEKEAAAKDAQLRAALPDVSIEAIADGEWYGISVPHYVQEKNYWCGPASARQALSFHKTKSGSSTALPSQSTLSSRIGTETYGASTTTGIRDGLNYYKSTFGFSANPYVAADITNVSSPQATFESRIKGVLKNQTNAPIILVETKYIPRYQGTALRHYVTVSGYSYDYTTGSKTVRTVDPNYMTAYTGTHWDPLGTTSVNGVFRAVYMADVNGSNMAMVY